MSTAIAKNFQVGNDSTATNNFTIRQPATPDGTVRIANGNTGTTTDLVTINSAGQTTITGNAIINSNTASDALRITQIGAGNALVVEDSANPDATPFVIDASGNVFKGYTASISTPFPLGFQINGTAGDSGMSLTRWVASGASPSIYLAKSRGAAVGTRGIVSSGDNIGSIDFTADDGTNFVPAAQIVAAVDNTPGTNDMPGNLRFNTTADGASATTERMRIDSAGRVGIGVTPSGGQFGDRLQIGLTTSSTTSVTSFYNQLNVSATSGSGAYAAVNSLTVANATFAGTGALIGTNSAVASQTTNTVADVRLFSGTYSTTGGGAVTNLYNFLSNPATLTSGTITNHFGFYSNIASGTGRWNFYANGTASNYFAGPVQLAAGTAAAPSLTAFGDTNTGLFYPAADTVGISTGGTEKMRIDSSGNLNVGGSSVQSGKITAFLNFGNSWASNYTARALGTAQGQLAGYSFNPTFQGTGDNGPRRAADIWSGFNGGAWTTEFLAFGVGTGAANDAGNATTERMRIDGSGNVGIGTSSPGAKLEIGSLGVFRMQTGSTVFNTTPTAGATDTLVWNTSNALSGFAWNTNSTEKMRLTPAGNLGIGNANPDEKLVVSGAITTTAQAAANKTTAGTFDYYNPGVDNSTRILSWGSLVSSGTIGFWTGVGGSGTTEKMRIDSSGNLQVQAGAVVVYQPAPASITTTATLTNADIQAQIINTTGTSYTVTMPLGTTLETLAPWVATNLGYDFSIINTASGTITIAGTLGVTTLGALTIATGTSAQFRVRRTAANTFVLYRLS